MPVEVKLFDDLGAVAADASGALDRARQDSLFDRLDWFALNERHCAPGGRLLVLRAREGEDRAWLLLTRQGSDASSLAGWYSLRFGLVGSGPDPARLAPAIVRALRSPARIGRLDLFPIEADDPLVAALRSAGWIVRIAPATLASWTSTENMDFAAYWASRTSRLRNTAARKAKAAALDIQIHRAFDDTAWSAYEQVYRQSWKPEEGAPGFLRALAEQEGAAGTLRLGLAYKDGRPIAGQLWLTENGTATIHKLAYVEDAKALSPGTVLSTEMFRHAIDTDKVRCIDFGLGDDGYKADWVDQRRPLYRLAAFDARRPAGWGALVKTAASKLVGSARND